MQIKIWSDVVCPFCYMGKRKLEKALKNLNINAKIEWKSFQLNPDTVVQPDEKALDHLSRTKGWSPEQTLEIAEQTTIRAKQEGLNFRFDLALAAHTLNAHRLIHWAQHQNKGSEVKEALLKAYFTDGLDINELETLAQIAESQGLSKTKAVEMLHNAREYHQDVMNDQREAQTLGVRGVPFFVFNEKFGLNGAQPVEVFEEVIKKAIAAQ